MGRDRKRERADAGEPSGAPEALVYIPGLRLTGLGEKSKRGVVTRIAKALDQESADRSAEFVVRWNAGAVEERHGGSDVATILRSSRAGEDEPVLDCYAFEWSDELTRKWREQGRFRRAFRLLMTLLSVPSFLRFFTTSGKKNPTGRSQLFLALVATLLVGGYFVVLAVALGQTAWQAKDELPDGWRFWQDEAPAGQAATDAEEPGQPDGDEQSTVTGWQWTAIIGSAIAAVTPGTRRNLGRAADGLGAAASYVRVAEGRPQLTGELTSYLEELTTRNDYQRVTVVAYSFGSVVAMDALFPTTSRPPRTYASVKTLVTIGSPYDFVVALRPRWKEGRKALPGVPEQWVNIYSGIDLMGSNFRTDTAATEATARLAEEPPEGGTAVSPTSNLEWDLGIEPSWGNLLELHGLSSHGLYWGSDNEKDDTNVFTVVVQEAFGERDLLGGAGDATARTDGVS